MISSAATFSEIDYILFTECEHNLEDYIQMDNTKGPGQVINLTQFVQRFYKSVV